MATEKDTKVDKQKPSSQTTPTSTSSSSSSSSSSSTTSCTPISSPKQDSKQDSKNESKSQATAKGQTPTMAANPSDSSDGHLILDYLFLGGEDVASDEKKLKEKCIHHILNMTDEVENAFPNRYEYHNIMIDDDVDVDIGKHFEEATNLIEKARKEKQAILVHCLAGVSRSSTIVLAYLIRYGEMTLYEAYFHVKKRRHCIRPNTGFMKHLIQWEKKIKGQSTIQISHYEKKMFEQFYNPEYGGEEGEEDEEDEKLRLKFGLLEDVYL